MAEIKNIRKEKGLCFVELALNQQESELIKCGCDFAVLPTDTRSLDEVLTSGKLGTGNRVMVPNKLLARHSVKQLFKKLPAKIFDTGASTLLLIKLEQKGAVPVFGEGSE